MSTPDIHPEEQFLQLIEQAIEYGAEHRNDISKEVIDAALAVPTNLAHFIKVHGGQLGTQQVHPEFRNIPAYFDKLEALFQRGHNLRENSAPAQPQQEEVTQ